MFLDGPQKENDKSANKLKQKTRDSSSQTISVDALPATTASSFAAQQLLTRFNVKLGNRFGCNTSKIAAKAKTSTTSQEFGANDPPDSYLTKDCTAINDKIIDESNIKLLNSSKNRDRMRSRCDSIEGQARNWIPSIKSTLQKSLSLQGGAKTTTAREQIIGATTNSKAAKQPTNESYGCKLFKSEGRHKCAISQRVGKYDSWLVNNGVVKTATNFLGSMFILLALLSVLYDRGASFANGASLPPAAIQPIWLRDGLITIGHESIEDDLSDEPHLLSNTGQERFDRLPFKLREQHQEDKLSPQTEEVPTQPGIFGEQTALDQEVTGRIPWFQIVFDRPFEKKDDETEAKGDELFWIERRRLERDRALEPPPWLREQPMRRNIVQQPDATDSEEEIAIDIPRGTETQIGDGQLASGPRPNRGRQSRQSADQIYESLIKLLAEGTYGTGSFLDDLQSEVELRNRANQRLQKGLQTAETTPGNSELPMQLQESQKQQHLQSTNQNEQVKIDTQETLGQSQEPEATLVVAGDEVSSGDDSETTIDTEGNSKHMSAAYTMSGNPNTDDADQAANSETAYGNAFSTSLSGMALPKQVSFDSQPIVSEVPPLSEGARLISNADLSVSPIPIIEQQPAMSSFHVVEDIDQMDNSQDSETDEHPSYGLETNDMSASQLQPDITNWGNQNQPAKSFQMKRSAAPKLFPKPVETGGAQQLRESNEVLGWVDDLQSNKLQPNKSPKSLGFDERQLIIALLESGELTKGQLERAASKFKAYIEDMIGLERGTILGFFPMSGDKLLIKLDTSKPNPRYVLTMLNKYGSLDFARGYIVMAWSPTSQENPVALLSAILRGLAKQNEIDNSLPLVEPTTATTKSGNDDGDDDLEAAEVQTLIGTQADETGFGKTARFAGNRYWLANAARAEIKPSISLGRPIEAPRLPAVSLFADEQSDLGGFARPLSLAALANYLSALYAVDQFGVAKLGASSSQVDSPKAEKLARKATSQSESMNYRHYIPYMCVALGALLCIFITFKLIMGKPRRALRRRFCRNETLRSLWSESSEDGDIDGDAAQIGGVVGQQQSQTSKGADLQAGNPLSSARRQLSDDSGLVSNTDSAAKEHKSSTSAGIDVLAQRLINLLRYHHHYQRHKDKLEPSDLHYVARTKRGSGDTSRDKEQLDEVSADDDEDLDEPCDSTSRRPFRSSNSYIKSLIDVLSKARAQFPASYQQHKPTSRPTNGSSKADRTPLAACDTLDRQADDLDELILASKSSAKQVDEELAGVGVAMSQMDISAAHLILAYMEKHLEDREQLRREWLELNGNAGSSSSKIVQLTLQKLAKVALSDQNRGKNRNCLVVPFDRNRVRLLAQAANDAEVRQSVGASGDSIKQPSDYINASYIYDDDLRRPTHIIAQGPTAQTCGQFWQMIWEQGISVVVMLTRLSENSSQLCHCYWPKDNSLATDSVQQQQPEMSNPQGTGDAIEPLTTPVQRPVFWRDESIAGASASLTSGGSSPTAANGRRVSVTSVFNTFEARQNGNGQPIVANRELSNNTICFEVVETTDNVANEDLATTDKQTGGNAKKTRFEVHLVSEHVSCNDYLVRNMYMINRSTGETRTITQFHYLAWPENGVPDNVRSFLAFRRKVHKSYRNLKSPILVHCSDGGGRSGTYTLIDIILERIKNGAKEIDPRATLEHLRDQRVGLCATQSQFEFVSVALAEEIQIILNALPK